MPRSTLLEPNGPDRRDPLDRLTVSATNNWWLLLLTGVGWLIVSIVIFRLDYSTVTAVGVLFGIIALGSAANDFSLSGMPGWWLLVITGLAELLIGFWAAGSWNLSVVVLVAWVGATALMRGITEIVGAFQLRELNGAARS
jgi:uncharacterized membrane protein HdeD (DUF308 family)